MFINDMTDMVVEALESPLLVLSEAISPTISSSFNLSTNYTNYTNNINYNTNNTSIQSLNKKKLNLKETLIDNSGYQALFQGSDPIFEVNSMSDTLAKKQFGLNSVG
jgi:hypothetical protein